MLYVGILLGIVVLLLLVALVKTLLTPTLKSTYVADEPEEVSLPLAEKLSKMVQCDTTSFEAQNEPARWEAFHQVLQELFPLVHEKLEVTDIDGNLLYYWQGKSREKPILLMSHQDVVPAGGEWKHPPFSGLIEDGKVWGRGASDTKCSVMAFLQAVEELLSEGYTPDCDVYLSSSCTEEWGGDGCPKLVEEIRRRGVDLFLVMDEGGGIIREPIGGIPGNFAMMGVFEKGCADVTFTARGKGGHASAPGKDTPIDRLSAFVRDVNKYPFRKKLLPEVSAMFSRLSAYGSFPLKLLLGNLWLFGPLLKAALPTISPTAAAMLKTTVAFTMSSGSAAFNVLPRSATVSANLRYIPHQGEKETLAILEKLAKKHDLEMTVVHSDDFSPSCDIQGEAFRSVEAAIRETFPGLPAIPYVVTGATDARFYQRYFQNCVRFAPVIYGPEQMAGMHAPNENIEYNCLPGAVRLYKNLIKGQKR